MNKDKEPRLHTVPKPSQEEIVRAATNDPALSATKVMVGDREFTLVDLPYEDYLAFLARLQPLIEAFASQVSAFKGLSSADVGSLTPASILKYCGQDMPEMAYLACKQTDPTITVAALKKMVKSPFQMATIVLKQVEHNKIISEIASFFGQILPLLKSGGILQK